MSATTGAPEPSDDEGAGPLDDVDKATWGAGADEGSAVVLSPAEWRKKVWAALLGLCKACLPFTPDDVHLLVPESPSGTGAAWGPLYRRMRAMGYATPVGYTTTALPEAHCRPVRIWLRTNHPDLQT